MAKTTNQATFRELYDMEVKKDALRPSAAKQFITEIAKLTHRQEAPVRMWLYTDQIPDELAKSVIARKFKTTADVLFPTKA